MSNDARALTPGCASTSDDAVAGMVKRYHASFPSLSYGFDSRYPLQNRLMTRFLSTLDRPDLEALGIEGWAFGYADRVRFGELDALNHVNNVVFLRWFENLRVAYIQDYGFTNYSAGDPMMVVRRVTADYHAPMFQNESYVLTARTRTIKSSSFVMEYGAFVAGQLRATGEAVVISLEDDGRTRRAHSAAAIDAVVDRDRAERQD